MTRLQDWARFAATRPLDRPKEAAARTVFLLFAVIPAKAGIQKCHKQGLLKTCF